MSRVWAIIVAGGSGRRFGSRKQFASLAGRPVIAWSLDPARSVCAGVVVVVPPDRGAATGASGPDRGHSTDEVDLSGTGQLLAGEDGRDARCAGRDDVIVVCGGATRSDSVRAGLEAVAADADVIIVHDAARPLSGLTLWHTVVAAVAGGADGAIPVVAVSDTIKRVEADGGLCNIDRSSLWAVQTPQAFRADLLRRAHATGDHATDDATLVEAVGGRVVLVDGHPANAKITVPSDLIVAEALLPGVLAW